MKKFFSAALISLFASSAFAVPVLSVTHDEAATALSNVERKIDVDLRTDLEVYLIETSDVPSQVYLVVFSPGTDQNHFTAFRLDAIDGYVSHRLFDHDALRVVGHTAASDKEVRGAYRELMIDFSSARAALTDAARDHEQGKEDGQDKDKGKDKEEQDALVAAQIDVVIVEK